MNETAIILIVLGAAFLIVLAFFIMKLRKVMADYSKMRAAESKTIEAQLSQKLEENQSDNQFTP